MPTTAAKVRDRIAVVRRVALRVLIYLILPAQALLPVSDPDIWWHLSTGRWILQNGAVPFEDPFSAYGAGRAWIAYSWLFELIAYAVYVAAGIPGLVWLTAAMALLIAFAVHALVRRKQPPLSVEVLLAALALGAMKPLASPRPWLFSILFFSLELLLIARARESENGRELWLLPPLFVVWASLHIQFVYGLAAVGLLFLESLLARRPSRLRCDIHAPRLSPGRVASAGAACFVATLISPYHLLVYRPLVEYAVQSGVFESISELHPMFFRSPADWIVLFLALGAVFLLGRSGRWTPFPTLLLAMGVLLGFRARRDIWVLVLGSTAVVSDYFGEFHGGRSIPFTRRQALAAAVLAVAALCAIGWWRQLTESRLQAEVEAKYPAGAVEYIRTHRLKGPMFNTLDWGGYLIWRLPEVPVAIDGRTNLHGEERVSGLLNVWLGYPGWDANPELAAANFIIADHHRPLTFLLRRHPGYRVVYEDRVAVVFVPLRGAR
ncbi:MAG TPA: hypothetical protein VNN77_00800 [candidate division Zixibacteria bacterium]|nr:hypothetical protein [candidate division Zixibacteria bacterium]